MNTTLHPLAEDYLRRLDHAAWSLPGPDRTELLAEIRAHLEAGLTPGSTDADVRNLLAELGAPEDIVAAAQASPEGAQTTGIPRPAPLTAASPWGPLEILAVLGLTVGTFVLPIVGPVVGLVLAWASERWTSREKWVATVLTFLPVLVLSLGLVATVAVERDGTGQPQPGISEEAPVPDLSTGAPS
jgi:uncharacterized membrane protein